MLSPLATRSEKRMLRLRASTVEPVLGSLITYYGLHQISKKRQAGAAKVMYLAATPWPTSEEVSARGYSPATSQRHHRPPTTRSPLLVLGGLLQQSLPLCKTGALQE